MYLQRLLSELHHLRVADEGGVAIEGEGPFVVKREAHVTSKRGEFAAPAAAEAHRREVCELGGHGVRPDSIAEEGDAVGVVVAHVEEDAGREDADGGVEGGIAEPRNVSDALHAG